MGGFLGSFLGKLFADEFRAWLPWIQERAMQAAVRRLRPDQRERYNEEWRSHLNEVPGEIAKTLVAIGFVRAAMEMSSRREYDFSRIRALALYLLLLPVISVVYAVVKINSRNRYVFPMTTPAGDFIVLSRYCPLGLILYYSLRLERHISRLYWENCHYSSWRAPRLVMLETFFMEQGLIDLLSLGHVVLGRLSYQRWLQIHLSNLEVTEKQRAARSSQSQDGS